MLISWAILKWPIYHDIDYILRYGIAVSDPQHIVRVPDWPTISNTGSFPPESCIFSQIFNLCAFLGYFVSLTYYKFVQANGYNGKLNLGTVSITYDSYDMLHSTRKLKTENRKACFIIAVIAMFGITLGRFQNILDNKVRAFDDKNAQNVINICH